MKKKILVTGGDGIFSSVLKKKNKSLNLIFKSKKECNILKIKSIENCVKKTKPNIIIHTAGLSRPMKTHNKNISKSMAFIAITFKGRVISVLVRISALFGIVPA